MDREHDIPFVYQNGVMKPEGPLNMPEGWLGIARVRALDPKEVLAQPPISSWRERTLDDLAFEQGIFGPTNLDRLRGDWPHDESIDEFLAEVRRWRQ